MATATTFVDATEYLAPLPRRRVRRQVRLRLTDDSYPLEPTPGQAWLPVAFRAFAALRGRMDVADLLIVGTGNGLDALGAVEILDLRTLAVTDLHEAPSPSRARTCSPTSRTRTRCGWPSTPATCSPACRPTSGSRSCTRTCRTCPPRPPPTCGAARSPAGSSMRATTTSPAPFGAYRLALHHRCLRDARPRLHDGGGVLTAIGGRMPHSVAFDLHRSCGYRPHLVAFDVKLQVEADLVVPPYRDAEAEHGLPFTYYAPEAIALVAAARDGGLDGQALADAVAPELDALAMSAREAADRVAAGRPVAHSVLMVFGERVGSA